MDTPSRMWLLFTYSTRVNHPNVTPEWKLVTTEPSLGLARLGFNTLNSRASNLMTLCVKWSIVFGLEVQASSHSLTVSKNLCVTDGIPDAETLYMLCIDHIKDCLGGNYCPRPNLSLLN